MGISHKPSSLKTRSGEVLYFLEGIGERGEPLLSLREGRLALTRGGPRIWVGEQIRRILDLLGEGESSTNFLFRESELNTEERETSVEFGVVLEFGGVVIAG